MGGICGLVCVSAIWKTSFEPLRSIALNPLLCNGPSTMVTTEQQYIFLTKHLTELPLLGYRPRQSSISSLNIWT